MSFWQQCEGVLLDRRYRLGRCVSARENEAIFRTEAAHGSAAVRVRISDWRTDEAVLARWSLASGLSHPNLIRVFAADACELEGAHVIYVVMEYADDDLASVVRERALQGPEAQEVLESVLKALGYLHERGLVHGRIKPSNVLAVGETIKISSDALGRDGEERRGPPAPTLYDAPELASGSLSTAADVWSLGLTLVEVLTRQAPGSAPDLRDIGPPFREVIDHCLRPVGQQRWRVAQIASYLNAVERAAPPRQAVAAPTPAAAPGRPPRRTWLYAAGIAAAVLLSVTLLRRPDAPIQAQNAPPARATRAQRQAAPAPRLPAAPPPEQPRTAAPAPAGNAVWRVIVYTYRNAADARSKARQINAKWPHFNAEVFSIQPNRPPYLVALGGRMERRDALQLRQEARKAGLPRDSYIQNYSH
jgi:serine/threonine protein kinase